METRLASLKDAPFLAELHKKSFDFGSWSYAQLHESMALETTQAWLSEDKNEVLGFISIQAVGDEAEILTFCVSPDARRQGIGEILVQTVLTSARQRKIQKLFLEVASDNEAALVLYKKAGFRVTGKRTGYYKRDKDVIDALLLECIL